MAFDVTRIAAGVDNAMDKVSFIGKLALLMSATSDETQPTPGYMLPEICQITFQSGSQNQDLIDFLDDRLGKKSCYVKSKVLRIMKFLVSNGHPDFRQGLRKRSYKISEAIKYSGPPHPLHGNALYLQVRQEAKELSELLFMASENDSNQTNMPLAKAQAFGMGSSGKGRLEGFGSTSIVNDNKTVGGSILHGLRDMAQRVIDLSSDPRKDVSFGVSTTNLIPGYRPAAVPDARPTLDHLDLNSLPHSSKRVQKRHVAGIAGGGWDDGNDKDALKQDVYLESDSGKPHHSRGSNNSDKVDSQNELLKFDECASERQLVYTTIFVGDDTDLIPKREIIQMFVASCSHLNCEKIIELLSDGLQPSKTAFSMRSLLMLEALLRTDLVSPEFIAVTCCKHLVTLFMNVCTDNRIRQKARKVIRILEKLATRQIKLFSVIQNETTESDTDSTSNPADDANSSEQIQSNRVVMFKTKEEDYGTSSSVSSFLSMDTSRRLQNM